MTKRFCDTDIWNKEWYQQLTVKEKVLLKYIFDRCNSIGIWEVGYHLASFFIGEEITKEDLESINRKKLQFKFLSDTKVLVIDFIKFQYGKLSPTSKPHQSIMKKLNEMGLDYEEAEDEDLTIKQLRKRLTSAAKEKILIRDKFECQYCGSKEDLEIDHIIPLSFGGSNEDNNLITACHNCNHIKANKPLKEFIDANKERINFTDKAFKLLESLSNEEINQVEVIRENKIDYFADPQIDECFALYAKHCPDLCKLRFEKRTLEIRQLTAKVLNEIDRDIGVFIEICQKANELKTIVDKPISFRQMLNCYQGILNGSYKEKDETNERDILKAKILENMRRQDEEEERQRQCQQQDKI